MSTDMTDVRLDAIAKEVQLVQSGAILRLGQLLYEAQEIFRYRRDEGGFRGWTAKHLAIGHTTAYRLIGVYQRFGAESVPQMDTLPATVLYALAEPSMPDEVREAVVEKAAAGEKVTAQDVKALKAKLADKEEKLKKVRGQKEAADAYNDRLIQEGRSKAAEIERLTNKLEAMTVEDIDAEPSASLPLVNKKLIASVGPARACKARIHEVISAFIDEIPKEQWLELIAAARWQVDDLEIWVQRQTAEINLTSKNTSIIHGLTDRPTTTNARKLVALWDQSDEESHRQFVATRWKDVLALGMRPVVKSSEV